MVLPLVDEHKPKCYLCHEGFENIEKLREHQNVKHGDVFESDERKLPENLHQETLQFFKFWTR